jgi:PAS domain S-box-containing protein
MEILEEEQQSQINIEFLESLILSTVDSISGLTLEGNIIFWNKGSEDLYGYTSREMIGNSILTVYPENRMAELPLIIAKIKAGETIPPYLTLRKKKDGSLIDVAISMSPVKDREGLVTGASMITHPFVGKERVAQYTRSLIEASLDPLVSISPLGKIIDANDATVKVTGYSKNNLVNTDFTSYFTEPEKAIDAYKQVFEKGIVTDFPLTIKHKEGKLTDVLYSATSYKDDEGNILAVFATARDITTTKQAFHYARSLIEASLDPLVTINPQGKITDVNEATVTVTGVARDKLIDSDFFDYFTEPEKARDAYKLVFSQGNVRDYPLTIRHANGRLTDVLYNASVYKDVTGNVLGVFAAARDITAQKQASLYARSLIEASLDPLVTISTEGKVMDVNEATTIITGIPKNEMIGTDFFFYFTEPQKARAGYEEVFSKGFVKDYPLAIRHKSGKIIDVLYNASVYKDDKGNVLGVCAAARDITQQRQISQYARSLIEASLDPLVTISPDGKITDVNEATIQVTGMPRDKLIDSDFLDYFTEPEEAREGYTQVFKEGFVRDYPLAIRHVSGRITDVLYNASVYRDVDGKVLGICAAARDITQRKKAEEIAHEASAYARSLIESSLDPLITINPEGKITAVNHAAEIITGVTREWLIGSDFTIYFTEPRKAREGYRLVLKDGLVRDFPLAIRQASGKIIDVLYNATVFRDAQGKVQGIFAAARDVTETTKTSLYARTLIEASQDPFVMMNPQGKITDVNEATIHVTGISREELIDTDFSTYFTEPDKARAGYVEVFEKGFIKDYPLTLRHLDGKLTDVLYNASVYKDKDGEVLGIFATARDYTRAKQATTQLENVNEELDAFTYSVAHDLKAPLRAIDGFSKILMADYGVKLDAEGVRLVDTIVGNTAKMGTLIENLLTLSHIGKSELKKEHLNMLDLVDSPPVSA